MTENQSGSGSDLKMYIAKKMSIGVILAVFVIILVKIVLGLVGPSGDARRVAPQREDIVHPKPSAVAAVKSENVRPASAGHAPATTPDSHAEAPARPETAAASGADPAAAGSREDGRHQPRKAAAAGTKPAPVHEDAEGHAAAGSGHAEDAEALEQTFPVVGMAFVDAVIRPLEYELTRRFYGWRPNDIVNFTDNVNNFQLGVLEVTRRSAVILAERISRTGSTAAFDPNLETAMNWFMIKADRYWFPSAESKYKAGLKELRDYFHRLGKGEAQFYSRTDNLIPLLRAYQDLLGSCDENLVKSTEDDGSPVSYFKADDYFFYAQGVATAMYTILRGIEKDFSIMVSREGGLEVLHHAIESCHHAMEVDPWIVLNSSLSSLFANHRMNMAAPISHARFYLGVLIKALST